MKRKRCYSRVYMVVSPCFPWVRVGDALQQSSYLACKVQLWNVYHNKIASYSSSKSETVGVWISRWFQSCEAFKRGRLESLKRFCGRCLYSKRMHCWNSLNTCNKTMWFGAVSDPFRPIDHQERLTKVPYHLQLPVYWMNCSLAIWEHLSSGQNPCCLTAMQKVQAWFQGRIMTIRILFNWPVALLHGAVPRSNVKHLNTWCGIPFFWEVKSVELPKGVAELCWFCSQSPRDHVLVPSCSLVLSADIHQIKTTWSKHCTSGLIGLKGRDLQSKQVPERQACLQGLV